jgi:predicted kinase
VPALEAVLGDNEASFAADPDVIPRDTARELAGGSRERLTAVAPLLEARARSGYVRHCHGDLHLRNIVELDGAPVLFDAIEFDDRLATIDVLYDLAFLLMDLGKRELGPHANSLLNAYLDAGADTGNLLGLAALPLFLSMRAAIRAKVELLRARKLTESAAASLRDEAQNEARVYFELARRFLAPPPPRLIAVGGLSGSGKSAVARAVAPFIGAFPGAVHVRSDVERKRLFGVAQHDRLPVAAYAPKISDQVYATCRKRARLALEGGQSVILDAVHAKPEERAEAAALAAEMGASFTGLWLEAPPETLRKRVAARQGDVSDATPEVVDAQLDYAIGPQDFAVMDAGQPFDQVVVSCLARLGVQPDRTH